MRPLGPDRDQRRRDTRLAWVIVGCSAVATLVLLTVGIWALSGPVSRGIETLATRNDSSPAAGHDGEAGKTQADPDDAETNLSGDNATDLPEVEGELHKRRVDEQDDDRGTARRSGTPRDGDDPPPARRAGPVA